MIQLHSVSKHYDTPAGSFAALEDIDLEIGAGEFATIVGRSGSGKSTLLNLVAGIDRPTAGSVRVGGTPLEALPPGRLAAWRGRQVGIVFQFFQLLPTLTVLENLLLPMDFAGAVPSAARASRARDLLERVGVADQAAKLPATLSGGQQQRVAIARALANDPPLILADEPTGNLDSVTGAVVLDLFADLARGGKTVVLVTHESDGLAERTRSIRLSDGRLA